MCELCGCGFGAVRSRFEPEPRTGVFAGIPIILAPRRPPDAPPAEENGTRASQRQPARSAQKTTWTQ